MQINGLRRIHIVSTVYCVWPLCTARAGICVIKTARKIQELKFYVHKNRLAVMYRLAVHNVKTPKRALPARFGIRRRGDIASH